MCSSAGRLIVSSQQQLDPPRGKLLPAAREQALSNGGVGAMLDRTSRKAVLTLKVRKRRADARNR